MSISRSSEELLCHPFRRRCDGRAGLFHDLNVRILAIAMDVCDCLKKGLLQWSHYRLGTTVSRYQNKNTHFGGILSLNWVCEHDNIEKETIIAF